MKKSAGGAVNFPLQNPETVVTLRQIVAGHPGVTTRAMFGQTAFFVAGQMAGGTWGSRIMLRLSPEDRVAADAIGGTLFDPMGGRPMSAYRVLPVDLAESDADAWIGRAIAYTASLPPKPAPKPGARKVANSAKTGARSRS